MPLNIVNIVEDPDLFAPHPGGQAAFLGDYIHRYVAFAGGWGSGKSWAGARKLANLHVLNSFDEEGSPTCVKGLAIAPTYQLALDVNVPMLRGAFDEMGLATRVIRNQRECRFVFPELGSARNPSEILVRSAEIPSRLAGFEVGHIWGDEVARWRPTKGNPMADAMIQAEGRLRDIKARFLQANYTFTHEGDQTLVYERFERNPTRDPQAALYRASTTENPLMRDYAAEKRRVLPPELAAQYVDGKAMSLVGARVYNSFDPAIHLDEKLLLCDVLPLHLSIDFNIDPGMHAVVGQYFPGESLLTAVHELHSPNMNARALIDALRDLIEREHGKFRWPELWCFGDASGHGRWAGTGQSCWEIVKGLLDKAAIPWRQMTPHANPLVADRVASVNCALRGVDDRARYKIHPRCNRLIDDFKRLRWNKGHIDKAHRQLSHASDAEGYRIHELLPIRKPEPRIRTGTVGFSP